jgi:MarR family transcriptional regulator, temperature-dependent positive regulator of motility
MKSSDKTFQVLDALDRLEISTQRQLADHSGISLGQVNYILKSLLKKGLVKIDNFRKNPDKIVYAYLLTPKGIEAKSRLAVRFVIRKIKEYDEIRERLAKRLNTVQDRRLKRVILLGPPILKEFIDALIKEKGMDIVLAGHVIERSDLTAIDPGTFDVALVFDDLPDDPLITAEELKIPKDKFLALW